MNPRVPMGHLRTEIMSNSCDPQAWEHGGDEETADVARRKGTAPRRDGLRRGVRRDFGRWGQPAAPRPASPMVEFLKIMAKYGFRLQRGTGDQGGKTQYTHTISISSYHKCELIGNGMTVASTHFCKVRAIKTIKITPEGKSSIFFLEITEAFGCFLLVL